MPVPGLELASPGLKRVWDVSRYGVAIPDLGWSSASPGARAARQSFIDSAARFGVDAFITGEVSEQTIHSARGQGCIFMLRVTMPLNVVVFAHWASG
ncbi:Nif3-like dinuclear metal center hexameric protein [Escherichia coli]|nr:Nif3-like dinuclear metal center hexameric protein [Escherichia coli]